MNDQASDGASIRPGMLDAVCDALTVAFIVFDKNDLMVFASRQVLNYFPVAQRFLAPGTRLRDFLGAVYHGDPGGPGGEERQNRPANRQEWLAERIASHWRERSDTVERYGPDRWLRIVKRRLPNGYGVCVIADVSEHKKREEQWRADLERVQLTEEILDNLPFPVSVKDRNLAYVAVNQAYCRLRGMSADELLGRKLFDDAVDRHVLDTGVLTAIPARPAQAGGGEIAVVTCKQRVGKPGRYFLVTCIENVSELALARTGENRLAADAHMWPLPAGLEEETPVLAQTVLSNRLSGYRVLLVTADISVETSAMKVLGRLGLDACCVHSAAEQEAFLDVAGSVGVKIDLILADTQMDVLTLEMAKHRGIDALALDGFQLSSELGYIVVRHFNHLHRRDGGAADAGVAPDTSDLAIAAGLAGGRPGALQVLVAEDNDINQIVFSQILEGLGYSYKIAASGDEAVRLWESHAPQIVLMDVTLPGLNGFEAARRIREREAGLSRTPIVGVLAQPFDHDREECLAAGMNMTIMKPVSPDILEGVFRKLLHDRAETLAG